MFSLTGHEIAHFLLAMASLLAMAHLLGYLAEKLYIPRVIGEVAGGLVLGPTLLGHFYPGAFEWMFLQFPSEGKLFGLIYQIGLLMLMFSSGLKFQAMFKKEDAKIVGALIIGSTFPAFIVGWLSTKVFIIEPYMGEAQNIVALKIVIAVSIAITSIPVISKIMFDLGIIHSRFAKLVISTAGIHDIFLWVAVGVATAMASQGVPTVMGVVESIFITLAFIAGTLIVLTFLYKRWTIRKGNILFQSSNLGYFLVILFVTCAIASYLHVETIFGALLAGIAAKISLPKKLFERLEAGVNRLSFSWFIPVYFATVGLQLNLARHFDIMFFLKYFLFATVAQTIFVYVTARLMNLDHLTSLNFGFAINDRGGPGIVLGTVAFGTGIINQEFFAVIVMLSLITSWIPGSWLRYVVSKGWRLMPGDENLKIIKPNEGSDL